MNVTNEWGANYYVLVGTKQLNSINAFTTAPYSNGGNVVFWIALNSQKQWGLYSSTTAGNKRISFPVSFASIFTVVLTKGGTFGDSPAFPYLKADNVTASKFETSTYSTIPTVRWIALGTA